MSATAVERLSRHLQTRARLEIAPEGRRRAAVLVPLAGPDPARWTTLLVLRSPDLEHHPGQIAFPGGGIEAGDGGPEAAALREAEEEVGLARGRVEVLGRLDDLLTLASSNTHITPVVGTVADLGGLRTDGVEIARTLEVSIAAFRDPTRMTWETYHLPQGTVRVPAYTVPERVWGATARILHTLVLALDEAGL